MAHIGMIPLNRRGACEVHIDFTLGAALERAGLTTEDDGSDEWSVEVDLGEQTASGIL